jgi:hypothetical protein
LTACTTGAGVYLTGEFLKRVALYNVRHHLMLMLMLNSRRSSVLPIAGGFVLTGASAESFELQVVRHEKLLNKRRGPFQ